jgi:hypothetical protein
MRILLRTRVQGLSQMLMATRATQDITTQDITRKYYSWSILHASEEEERNNEKSAIKTILW